jgi:8-oxo-dGTP pyrophosphatase MutT (NUDIX family)
MLHRLDAVNDVPYDVARDLIDFGIHGRVVGKVSPGVADRLCSAGRGVFEMSTGTNRAMLTLGGGAGNTPEARTRSVMSVMTGLRDGGYVSGWRDEMYPVGGSLDEIRRDGPMFLVERACASLLGVTEYGVHVNGLVTADDDGDGGGGGGGGGGATRMWMARRSKTKSKYPGCIDHVAAGGQPHGSSLLENAIKECHEEAGVPPDVARRRLRPAGAVCYENYEIVDGRGRHGGVVNRVVLFCYDLVLPRDFVPRAVDGEVENFFTWSMEDVCGSMDPAYGDPLKPNCYPGELRARHDMSQCNI